MMAAPSFLMIFSMFLAGGNIFSLPLGLPPGERDAAMQRVVAEGCVVYSEWAARSDGTPGGKGLEGLMADEEIVSLVTDIERAILTKMRSELPDPKLAGLVDDAPASVRTLLSSSGCLFVSLGDEPLGEATEMPNPGSILPRLRIGMVIGAGSGAGPLEKHLLSLLAMAGNGSPTALDRVTLPLPTLLGPVLLHRQEGYLMVAVGEPTLEGILAGLAGKQAGISKNERIQEAFAEVQQERTGRWSWIDVRRLVEVADVAAGSQARVAGSIAILGLSGIDSIATTQGLDAEGSLYSRVHLHTDGQTAGVLSLAAGRALKGEDFAHIPSDADLVVAKSLNGKKILAALREILGELEPNALEELEDGILDVERELGVSIEKDLLTAFGEVWTLYDSPSNGGVLVSSPVLALEVRDPQRAYAIFTELMKLVKNQMPGDNGSGRRRRGVFLGEQKFEGHTIYFINTVGDDDFPLAPAFCVTDTHFLMTLHPQTLKGHLRHLAAKGETLATDDTLANRLKGREAIVYSSCDTQAIGRYLMAFAPYLGQMLVSNLQTERIAIDSSTLPSARAILPYLNDSWLVVSRNDHGLSVDSANGLLLPSGEMSFLVPYMMLGIRSVDLAPPNHQIQEAVPAVEEIR